MGAFQVGAKSKKILFRLKHLAFVWVFMKFWLGESKKRTYIKIRLIGNTLSVSIAKP
jgi:hypothetical protein